MGVIGGGLLVAVAAALWLAYLVPIWIRQRQYLATERNAVRLQQTLRILAETAETPEPVVIEATARQVAAHQRVLHEQERAARLHEQAGERLAIAERRAAQSAADAAADVVASIAAPPTEPIHVVERPVEVARSSRATSAKITPRMLRRRRALCSLLLLAGSVTVVVGLILFAFATLTTAVTVLVVGGSVATISVATLAVLARVRVARPVASTAAPIVSQVFEPVEFAEPEAAPEGWTPRPLPRPLTLSRGTIAATAMASIEAAAELQRISAEAERAKRIEELEAPVPIIAPAASTTAPVEAETGQETVSEPVSPYARMGVVGAPQRRFDDLDAVLRRRRQAG
jgi:hypothetical protein